MSSGTPISTPTSGGAIRGLGESFGPDPHTGTGGFAVPIPLLPGRSGFQPELTLQYSTGFGNGPFGLGWQLSVPSITRKTSAGVPRYTDDDVFTMASGEDLVALAGTARELAYRPRTEGTFAEILRRRSEADDIWVVRSIDGQVTTFGTPGRAGDDHAVLADRRPTDLDAPAARGRRVFTWRPSTTVDVHGNIIRYRWATTVGPDSSVEQLLMGVDYVDLPDTLAPDGEPEFLLSVEFEYDQAVRPDALTDRRAGFAITTSRRCRRIAQYSHAGERRLVRTVELRYLDEVIAGGERPNAPLPPNGVSLLSQITARGHDGDETESLPPLDLIYTSFDIERRSFRPLTGSLPADPLGTPGVEMVDLFGDGLPDFLQLDGRARYWRNLGDGRFAAAREMTQAPAGLTLASPSVDLIDADGDGRPDLLVSSATLNGYFPLMPSGGWDRRSFHAYRTRPSFELGDPSVRLIDLTGDGITDALRSSAGLECFFQKPGEGWSKSARVSRRQLTEFPDIDLTNAAVRIADMTGDGLSDIVVISGRSVSYWPSLGHGRWGARVSMRTAADLPTDADPARIVLGDLDGDGAADLCFVEDGAVRVWINRAGLGWSPPATIVGTPRAAGAHIRLVDVAGTGTDQILWSRPSTAEDSGHAHVLDLTGGSKPYLLTEIDNNLGALTRIHYVASTAFRIEDQHNRHTHWQTTMPAPVQVVARVEKLDRISGSKLVTRYRYRHGYWDGVDREFRGFGFVEQHESESFTDYHADTSVAWRRVAERHFAPPTSTRTWFHQGPVIDDQTGDWHELDHTGEFWHGDPSILGHTQQIRAFLAGYGSRAGAREDRRGALRALRGLVLRVESYTEDGSALAERPHTVTEYAYDLREASPPTEPNSDRRRVFFAIRTAERNTVWDRGDDPQSTFTFSADHDELARPRRLTEVAAPRRSKSRVVITAGARGPVLVDPTSLLVLHQRCRYAAPAPGVRLHDRVAEQRGYTLSAPPTVIESDPDDVISVLRDQFAAARTVAAAFDADEPVGAELIEHTRFYYDGPAFVGLPLGECGTRGMLSRVTTLAMTDNDLDRALGAKRPTIVGGPAAPVPGTPGGFGEELGYTVETIGGRRHYWAEREANAYDAQRAHPHPRGLVVETQDAGSAPTRIDYDEYRLLPIRVVDPVGLATLAEYDYGSLKAIRLVDANDNVSEFAFSPLGLLRHSWARGKSGRGQGDQRHPGLTTTADFDAFRRSGQPACLTTIRRAYHDTDTQVPVDKRDLTFTSREYSDGFGRIVQVRTQAEEVVFGDGGADTGLPEEAGSVTTPAVGHVDPDRVVVSGWTVFDNLGRPVQVYDPFFSDSWDFDAAAGRGEPETIDYDARGRRVRITGADGAQHRLVPGVPADLTVPDEFRPTPWEVYRYDANDLAGLSLAPDGSPLADRAPAPHHYTPASEIIDGLGRVVATVGRTGAEPSGARLIQVKHHITGYPLEVTDPAGRVTMTAHYDRLGRALRTTSADAGDRWRLFDAQDREFWYCDADGRAVLQTFDGAGRPVDYWARDDGAIPLTLRQRIEYGDQGDRATGRERNLLGQPVRHFDEAGLVELHAYDLKGNTLAQRRRFLRTDAVDTSSVVDWAAPGATGLLDQRSYATDLRLDAVDRVQDVTLPADHTGHRAVLSRGYNRGGALDRISLDGIPFVQRIGYDAEGNRVLVAYGNNVMTRYRYDPQTGRLTRQHTQAFINDGPDRLRPAGPLYADEQLLYDLVGNVVELRQRAPGCGIPGTRLGPDALDRRFDHDPLYRLVRADGRECEAAPPGPPGDIGPRCSDPTAVRPYSEEYRYDDVDNLVEIRHRQLRTSGATVVTRTLTHPGPTNRLQALQQGTTSIRYSYDGCGNVTAESDSRRFSWGHHGRLTTFSVRAGSGPASLTASYRYNASGDRALKVVRMPGRTEVTAYIDGALEHRWVDGIEQFLIHVGDDDQPIALIRVGPPLPGDHATELPVQYHFGDHLGSSQLVLGGATAADHSFVRREEYTPFGSTTFGGFGRKRFRFVGQECDSESGLYAIGARYYAPWLCRWTSCDPAGIADGLNLYSYASNNPVVARDTNGEASQEVGPPPRCALFKVMQPRGGLLDDGVTRAAVGSAGLVRGPGCKASARTAGSSAHKVTKAGATGTDDRSTPGVPGGSGPPGSNGVPGGTDPVSSEGGAVGAAQGAPTGGDTGSPNGSPTGSATGGGGSPNGTDDPTVGRSAKGLEGGRGGKGTYVLSELDLAVLLANAAADPLGAALDAAGAPPSADGKTGGLPGGDNPEAEGSAIAQGVFLAAQVVKAALSVAGQAAGAVAKSGTGALSVGKKAIAIGSGKGYSVLAEIRLKRCKFGGFTRSSHRKMADEALAHKFRKDPATFAMIQKLRASGEYDWHHVLKEATWSGRAEGVMQLVPKSQHQAWSRTLFHNKGGRGGMWQWGWKGWKVQ